MGDHPISIEYVTLGLMMLATILTVFTGWNRTTERIAKLEARLSLIIKFVTPRRRSDDVIEDHLNDDVDDK